MRLIVLLLLRRPQRPTSPEIGLGYQTRIVRIARRRITSTLRRGNSIDAGNPASRNAEGQWLRLKQFLPLSKGLGRAMDVENGKITD